MFACQDMGLNRRLCMKNSLNLLTHVKKITLISGNYGATEYMLMIY